MHRFSAAAGLFLVASLMTQCHAPKSSMLSTGPESEVLMEEIQDFSYAGYGQGLSPIIIEGAKEIIIEAPKDGVTDASLAIQAFFDKAMAEKGKVLLTLPVGLYRIEQLIKLSGHNIILRGDGPAETRLLFTSQAAKLVLGGFTSGYRDNYGSWKLQADAPIGANAIEVMDARGLKEGLDIAIDMKMTSEFIQEHKASPWWDDQIGKRHEVFRRQIVGIKGNTVFLDTPLRYPMNVRDDAEIKVFSKHNSELGLEGIGVHTAAESVEKAWELGGKGSAISISQCRDCWVRKVESFALPGKVHHLLSHGLVIDKSYRVTVDEVHLRDTQHRGEGGNGYLFIIGSSNEVLIKNSSGENGRHNLTFVGRFSNSGNVIHKFKSSGGMICSSLAADLANRCGVGPIDTHESLAIANLFDRVEANDGFEIGNRQFKSDSVGPTGTLNTVWNMTGRGFLRSYNSGMGFVVGTAPTLTVHTSLEDLDPKAQSVMLATENEDYAASIGELTSIPSLYIDQLNKRRARQE